MWRPKEWKNPCTQEENQTDFSFLATKFSQADMQKLYEMGADAMLNALLTSGIRVNNLSIEHQGEGTVIFIQDE